MNFGREFFFNHQSQAPDSEGAITWAYNSIKLNPSANLFCIEMSLSLHEFQVVRNFGLISSIFASKVQSLFFHDCCIRSLYYDERIIINNFVEMI